MNDTPPRHRQSPGNAPWWDRAVLADRRARLEARNTMAQALRHWFMEQGFTEVETPALQVSPGLEPQLRAFETRLFEPFAENDGGASLYLHTSPEFAMKKLLAGGMDRIFQLARVWRNAERSALHHPEFTMLEWYRAGAGWRDVAADCEALVRAAVAAVPPSLLPAGGLCHGGASCDPAAKWDYLSVAEVFQRVCGIDLLATAPDPGRPDGDLLAAAARGIGVRVADGDGWDDVFFRILLERIEPRLGVGAPTVLHSWPASMAALARVDPDDARVAERFEVFVCGVELANGFGELTDPAEQRRRFEADLTQKEELTGERYPIDEDFLAALADMPEAAGTALGFDRLVMLATDAARIEDVLWAPVVAPQGGPGIS